MASNTPNLVLRKPDPSDLVNVLTDLGNNFDKLDAVHNVWTSYTPVWGSTSTAPGIGNGTITGRYKKNGKDLDLRVMVTMGTTTTYGAAAWTISLPPGLVVAAGPRVVLPAMFNLASSFHGVAYNDAGATALFLLIDNGTAGGSLQFPTGAVPAAWANGHNFAFGGRLEVA